MAGAGYKLFATGDVLTAAQVNTYLMQQTVMVFASSAARTTALSGVLAEGMVSYLQDTNTLEVYDGSAWIGATGDITGLTAGTGISISSATGPVPTVAIDTTVTADLTTGQTLTNKTLTSPVLTTPSISNINAKGDILVGTADNTLGVITAGSNGDTLVADSSASTGLRYQTSANQNSCINGGMDIWQRGTSFTIASGTPQYTADRWTNYFNGTGTIAQETTLKPDTSTYSLKNTATGTSADNAIFQLVEQQQMEQFRGKVVTLSVKFAGTVGLAPSITLAYSTTANDTLTNTNTQIAGGSIVNPAINASTFVTWSVTFTVPTTAKQLRIGIGTGSVVNTNVLYVAEVQLELGSVATTFKKSGGTLQGELAACQRYYQRAANTSTYAAYGYGTARTTTQADIIVSLPVSMRVAPTAIDYSTLKLFNPGVASFAISALTIDSASNTYVTLLPTSTGLTQYRSYALGNDGATGYLGFTAEL